MVIEVRDPGEEHIHTLNRVKAIQKNLVQGSDASLVNLVVALSCQSAEV